jgi:hypothetical protein
MKKTIILTLVTVALSLSACNDFLDTKPLDFVSSVNYYQTESELNTALNGAYEKLGNNALYGNFLIGIMQLDADEGYYARDFNFTGTFVNNVFPADNSTTGVWQTCYAGINMVNLLLENINKAQGVSQVNRNAIEGEALFLRSYYYFLLVSNFGDVPLVLNSLPNAENTDIARTPAKVVYDKIIEDMTLAETKVKPISVVGFGGRISQSAVRGMLARVCLYAAGNPINDTKRFVEARDWAKKVMDDATAGHALNPDYSQVFINYAQDKYDFKESIWEVEFWGNVASGFTETGRTGSNNGIRTGNENIGYAYGFIKTTGMLFNKFERRIDGSSPDLRRDWSIAPFSYVGATTTKSLYSATQIFQRDCGKFRREFEVVLPKDKDRTPQNFPLLRYSDVLLMFAEAENQVNNGPTPAAYAAINLVRARAYGKLLPGAINLTEANLTGLDRASFLQAIQDERSRELSFESLRKRDLVRWNIYLFTQKQALANFSTAPANLKFGELAFKNATARDAVWPIPSREIGLNKLLTQNTGW